MRDEELLEAWRNGDQRAGRELFDRYYELLRRFFVNKVSSEEALADLIQDTLTACLQGSDRYRGEASFQAYLYGIARNLLYRHWSKRRPDLDADAHSIIDLGAGPTTLLARDERERRLLAALRRVPLRYQEVLELYYWEELKGGSLGEYLGVPEDTARTRLRAARQALGRELRRMERFEGVPETTKDNLEDWARRVRPPKATGS